MASLQFYVEIKCMNSQESQHNDTEQLLRNQHFTLLELLDRLLDKGAVVKGEILLSVADIELVYLNLGLLLSSVKTVEHAAKKRQSGRSRAALSPTFFPGRASG
jgi:hypothetical protein